MRIANYVETEMRYMLSFLNIVKKYEYLNVLVFVTD